MTMRAGNRVVQDNPAELQYELRAAARSWR